MIVNELGGSEILYGSYFNLYWEIYHLCALNSRLNYLIKVKLFSVAYCLIGSAEECRSKDQQGDIGGFLPPEGDSDISF